MVEKNEENITLNKGQKVLFDLFEIEHWIELSETKDWIRISMSNNQEIPLIQGHERKVDFNNDNLPDFLIILNSFYNNEANLTFKKLEKSSDEKYINIENEKLSEIIEKSEDKNIIINEVKYRAFEISFEFRSECLMRIQWDDEAEEQKLYAKGDVKIVRVANYLRIWASNAGSIKAEIIDFNKELKLGTFGEVISKLVRWQKAQTQGTYSIILANIK